MGKRFRTAFILYFSLTLFFLPEFQAVHAECQPVNFRKQEVCGAFLKVARNYSESRKNGLVVLTLEIVYGANVAKKSPRH